MPLQRPCQCLVPEPRGPADNTRHIKSRFQDDTCERSSNLSSSDLASCRNMGVGVSDDVCVLESVRVAVLVHYSGQNLNKNTDEVKQNE